MLLSGANSRMDRLRRFEEKRGLMNGSELYTFLKKMENRWNRISTSP
jgi:hypothetical protein